MLRILFFSTGVRGVRGKPERGTGRPGEEVRITLNLSVLGTLSTDTV
jgi:hypothetical protein